VYSRWIKGWKERKKERKEERERIKYLNKKKKKNE